MAQKKNSSKSSRFRTSKSRARLVRLVLVVLVSGGALCAAVLAGIFYYYISDPRLPTLDRAADYKPKQVTKVQSRDGRLIGEIFEERRTVVAYSQIPKVVVHAFVDAEDAQFFEHKGLNYWGMLRAILHNLRPGAHLHGASTITQQLVRGYILQSDARTLRRKIQEMYLSMRIEQRLTKEEILHLYLNHIYFGHGRYGIEEATRFYFGKSVSEVNVGEAALLASLPKGPEDISPRKRPERAKERQRYVLSQLKRYNHITEGDAKRYADQPIQLAKDPTPDAGIAPEFVDEAERYLEKTHGKGPLAYLGTTVKTTCDVEVQRTARNALEQGLRRLDERNGNRGALEHLSQSKAEERKRALSKEFPEGPPVGKSLEGVVVRVLSGEGQAEGLKVHVGGSEPGWMPLLRGDRYNPEERGKPAGKPAGKPQTKAPNERFKEGDVVRVQVVSKGRDGVVLALENGPQGAVVVLEPETRQVLALVGGYGFSRGNFNRALRAKRQPGSAFKPLLYAAAFESRKYTAATVMNDSPQIYGVSEMSVWTPKNAETEGFQGEMRLRSALAFSLNSIASQIIYADFKDGELAKKQERVMDRLVRLAKSAGVDSPLSATPALALGASEVTPLELTNSYATIAALGRHGVPQLILQVGGQNLPVAPLTQAWPQDVAYITGHVMRSVIEEGTARSAKGKVPNVAAGKTGTTNDQKDAWFVGFVPDLCTGVWVGDDHMRKLGRHEQGARAALPVWTEVMQSSLSRRSATPVRQPTTVVVARIDRKTGKLAAKGAESATVFDEVFLDGTQPTEEAESAGEENPNTFNQVP